MKYLFAFLIALAMISCSSSVVYKSLDEMPIKPKYHLDYSTGDTIEIAIELTQSLKKSKVEDSFIRNLKSIRAGIHAASKDIDSISSEEIKYSEVSDVSDESLSNLNSKAVLKWNKPEYINSNMLSFNLSLVSERIIYRGQISLPEIAKNSHIGAEESLKLESQIQVENDSTVLFKVLARRLFLVDNEYIPNSETIRLEILSETGKIVYSSNKNSNYFQVIKRVLPEEIGNVYVYKIYWNGKDNDLKELAMGQYDVRLTIPAKPKPYITQTKLEWKRNK